MRVYWTFRGNLAMIDGVVMTGKKISILTELQQALDQLCNNQIDIEKQGS